MYTLLIGKPPFESKDMKSTYKRILSNSYTFPSHTPVTEDARNLIRNLLQHRPDRRLSLDQILAHSFFTSPSAYMPHSLPENAIRETPLIVPFSDTNYNSNNKFPTSKSITGVKLNKDTLVRGSSQFTDENDPGVINRANRMEENFPYNDVNEYPSSNEQQTTKPTSALNVRRSSAILSMNVEHSSKVSAKSNIQATTTMESDIDKGSNILTRRGSKVAITSQASSAGVNTVKNYADSQVIHPNSAGLKNISSSTSGLSSRTTTARTTRSGSISMKTSSVLSNMNTKRFDVYEDNQRNSNSGLTSIETRPASVSNTSTGNIAKRNVTSTVSVVGVENIDKEKVCKISTKHRSKQQLQSNNMQSPLPSTNTDDKNNVGGIISNEICTPADQIINTDEVKEPKGTLEVMHEMLDKSYINQTNLNQVLTNCKYNTLINSNINSELECKPWIIRYVDYTSKYGLGFLMNNGSSGVYFNDATKIIQSSDGMVFQYIERRKRDNNSSSPLKAEHAVQTHLISSYPIDLQKKVTLLKHFRNYLMEQQKSLSEHQTEEVQSIPMIADNSVSGANPNIKSGISSIKYSACGKIELVENSNWSYNNSYLEDEYELPFVKKWVRTKHAILFRLSNKTLQVLFFDKRLVFIVYEYAFLQFILYFYV